MKKYILLIFIQIAFSLSILAQEDSESLVYETFPGSQLLESQTVMTPDAKGLEFHILHRFGKIKEMKDLFGIYAPSNILLSLDYGITDRLALGFASEKNHNDQVFSLKYALLRQTESNKIPVSVSYYGNTAITAIDKENYGEGYKFIDKLSFFNQIIIARKFSEKFSLELAGSFSHFNKVDSVYQNDALGITAGGTFKITDYTSIIFEYNQPIYLKDSRYYTKMPQEGLGLGFQIGTGTHVFQVFATTSDALTPQTNFVMNQNRVIDRDLRDPATGQKTGEKADLGIKLGFNIQIKF